MNNFQKLQEKNEEMYYASKGSENLNKDLSGTLSTFRFIGNVIDVYLPKVVDIFIAFAGGSESKNHTSSKGSDSYSDPASGKSAPEKGKGPGNSNDLPTIR